ncbi:NAD-dependent epimerase/dehydratase family protein [Rossellomorea sp. SC111]|uniref:NAD-dependent epimerase/dehydratase family protein n=1 Tax=Rossellomorea sp. SC111 TaxID=2968985 RepID=UPI00215B758D|nr:NAD-dependent epimerase/dehydratase family protein [Rossellomorea sp. SC111]MCR8850999.1 NAD-dependent epimerase/dehydratase family protein [Rossellomorea sp. SC111]
MKIIVTGGAGFIGSHLSRKLIEEKHELLIIDSFHPYYSPERKKRQLSFVREMGSFRFVQKDLLIDEEDLQDVFHDFKADCVVHLAAIPGVSHSLLVPNEYVDYDIKATINTLRMAGESGIRKFIFASSSSVYGNTNHIPSKEEDATGAVVSPYAAAKYSAESFCKAYASIYGMDLTILRFFTVYGPWGRPDMAIYSFIKKLMNGQGIPIYGLENKRDYTYIDDIVDGTYKAIKSEESGTFNLGNGSPISMEGLISELRTHFPALELRVTDRRVGDVTSTYADSRKAKEILGYSPSVSFAEGINRTVQWMKEYEQKDL